MKLTKANVAGLIDAQQQSEMKSILSGTWPALKPLPVFKYETAEYRATIDFDRKRGEWVCRKTSLPSNEIQELRGGLREISMALPHGKEEMLIAGAERQEQELEKDANRRLQALLEWRDKYDNGARYFVLRDFLSESQRTELDDSLRLSLTARQLQFNAKNVASVFEDLSTAGGRFAALIEFAKRNKTQQGAVPQAQTEGTVLEVAPAMEHDEQPLGVSSRELSNVFTDPILNNDEPIVQAQKAEEHCIDAENFPVLSIKDVFPEQEEAPFAEQVLHAASQQVEIELPEIVDAGSPSLIEHAHEEEDNSPAFTAFAERARTMQPHTERSERSSSRFPVLEISAVQAAAFALVSLAAIAFSVGLAVGRGPLGRRVPETPKSMAAIEPQSPTPRDQAGESAPRVAPPPVASSHDFAGVNGLGDATPFEQKSKESKGNSEHLPEMHSPDSDSTPTRTFQPSAKTEVDSEHRGAAGLIAPHVAPPASSKLTHALSAAGRKSRAVVSPAPYTPTSAIRAAPHLPGPATILVSVPRRGSQPFRVSFPEKAIAATSSFAMSSQLSVVVPPEPGFTVADKSARLEAGELVSFGYPHYPGLGDRHGLAEIVRVRATIGELGQVREVKFLDGAASLLPATARAIREWRYKPTLLDKRPVQAQQDITIEFRPPQYLSSARR